MRPAAIPQARFSGVAAVAKFAALCPSGAADVALAQRNAERSISNAGAPVLHAPQLHDI